jgi:MFS family permease
MNFITKMERKYGKYAIPNLTRYLIFTYVLSYLLTFVSGNIMGYFFLDVYQIFHGQAWRILTWMLIPPSSLNLFTIIMLFFYFSIGTTLEKTWGDFKYNLYIFGGIFATIIGAFLLYLGTLLLHDPLNAALASAAYSGAFSTYYISFSLFLGFALTYPEMRVFLFFLIPVKIKILALIYLAFMIFGIFQNAAAGEWGMIVVIVCSLLNVIVFFLATRRSFIGKSSAQPFRSRPQGRSPFGTDSFQGQPRQGGAAAGATQRTPIKPVKPITKHKCAICGRTEVDGDDLEFRFCSKCDGNYEYCQDHLFTHEHVHGK